MNIIDTIRVSGTDYTLSATSSGGASAVEVTQAEYDALVSGGTVDPTVFYIITDAQAGDLTQYWTSAQTNSAINAAVSGKVDTSTFDTYSGNVETALSGKQDTLSAGTGIDITNNVISATGGGGGGKAVSGGRGITVTSGETADTVSFNLPIYSGTGEGSIIGGFSGNTASGEYSIALGGRYESQFSYNYCKATNKGSVSFGGQATGEGAFTCGESTKASGRYSAAIGCYIGEAAGVESFITGRNNKAKGFTTFVSGYENTGENDYEFVVGHLAKSNKANTTFGDSGNTLFSVGNGASTSARHNAFEIRQNGDIYLTLDGQDVKLQDHLGGGGGSTFDENYPVLERESPNRGVQWEPLTSFTENSIYVKPSQGMDECAITISVDEIGDGYVNLYLTGSTVYSLYDGESAVLDYVNIQRDNGYFKITQIDFSKNVILTNNSNSEFYFVPYIIESGSTESAIKQAAQKTLDESIIYSNNFVAQIDSLNFENEDLKLYYSNGARNQTSATYTDFLTKDGEIYNSYGLKVKPIINSGTTTWSTILEVPNGKDFGSQYNFGSYIDGTYKKFRVYYNSGATFDDGEGMYILYRHDGDFTDGVQFIYNESQGTFVTENQDFTCTKQNYYLEFEYVGNNASVRWEYVYFYNKAFDSDNFYRIDVYGKQLLNLQEAYESLNDTIGNINTILESI